MTPHDELESLQRQYSRWAQWEDEATTARQKAEEELCLFAEEHSRILWNIEVGDDVEWGDTVYRVNRIEYVHYSGKIRWHGFPILPNGKFDMANGRMCSRMKPVTKRQQTVATVSTIADA